jgi:hypothetical protein
MDLNRPYILFRVLLTIYDVTGYILEETSWLDFEHHNDVMSEIESRLCDEFCLIELPDCDTVSNLVDSICEGAGIYMTRDEAFEVAQRCLGRARGLDEPYPEETYLEGLNLLQLAYFFATLEGEFGLELSDDETKALLDMPLGEIVDWLTEAKR